MTWKFPENSPIEVVHRDGKTWWYEAPLPRRWHLCRWQTQGLVSTGLVMRCACGAIAYADGFPTIWTGKNSRTQK